MSLQQFMYFLHVFCKPCFSEQTCSGFQICTDGVQPDLFLQNPGAPDNLEKVSNCPYYRELERFINLKVKKEDLPGGDLWH